MLPTPLVTPRALLQHAGRLLQQVRFFDVRNGPEADAAYLAGHLPGAVRVRLVRDLSGPAPHPEVGGRHPLPPIPDWAATLGRLGITPDTDVVLYDDQGGVNAAARAWWMLVASGHERVAVLDGGLQAAIEAGIAQEEGEVRPAPVDPYPVTGWRRPIVDAQGAAHAARAPETLLLDVRSPERYRGETEPIDPVAGHIPGALNVPLTANLDAQGRFRPWGDLEAHYAELFDDVDPTDVVVQCGSGVTACHTLLALEVAGLGGGALYVGSWSEWCRTDRPQATGPEPG